MNTLPFKVLIFCMLCSLESRAMSLFNHDTIYNIKGKWTRYKDSIDTSIGEGANVDSYAFNHLLFDFLRFKSRSYLFSQSKSKKDWLVYSEAGRFAIHQDTLFLQTATYPYTYFYKIIKLTKEELVIEEILYNETIGAFRLLGYYERKKR